MRLLRARLHWLSVWLAYQIWLRLPINSRVSWWLLPHAGHYAYSSDFADFCTTPSVRSTLSKDSDHAKGDAE